MKFTAGGYLSNANQLIGTRNLIGFGMQLFQSVNRLIGWLADPLTRLFNTSIFNRPIILSHLIGHSLSISCRSFNRQIG